MAQQDQLDQHRPHTRCRIYGIVVISGRLNSDKIDLTSLPNKSGQSPVVDPKY